MVSRHPNWIGLLMIIYRGGDGLGLASGMMISENSNPLAEKYYESFSDGDVEKERMWDELEYLEDLNLVETERFTDDGEEFLKIRLTPKGVTIAHQIQHRIHREHAEKFDRMNREAVQYSIAFFTVMLTVVTASEAAVIAFSKAGFDGLMILLLGVFPVIVMIWFGYQFYKGDLIPFLRSSDEY